MFLHIPAVPEDGAPSEGCLIIPTLTRASPLKLRRSFQQMIDEFYSTDAHRDTRLAARIDLLLCDLAQTPEKMREQWPATAVRAALLANPGCNYTAGELAERLGVSERRLRYLFRNACGVPLHRYQLNLKLDMARQLLAAEPDRTLADAAKTVGFTDAFHLSRAYRRRFGRPSQEDRRSP